MNFKCFAHRTLFSASLMLCSLAFLSTLSLRQTWEKRKFYMPCGKAADQSSALNSAWSKVICWCTGPAREEWLKSWEALLLATPFIFYRTPGPLKVSFLTVSCLDDASSVSLPDELCGFGTWFRKHPGDFPSITTVLICEHFCNCYKSYLHPTKQIKKKFAALQQSWVSWEYQKRATEIKGTLTVFEASINAGSNLCKESCPVPVLWEFWKGSLQYALVVQPLSWKL